MPLPIGNYGQRDLPSYRKFVSQLVMLPTTSCYFVELDKEQEVPSLVTWSPAPTLLLVASSDGESTTGSRPDHGESAMGSRVDHEES